MTSHPITRIGYHLGTLILTALGAVALSFYHLLDWLLGYPLDDEEGGK